MPTGFLFTELTAEHLTPGKAFDGLACGTFRDMHGRTVTFEPGELETYVANTLAAIDVTRGESGELVGLPIDAKDHDKGDGAGWIVGASISGNLVRLVPKWTEIGRELIGKSIRKFFSATVDTAQKVILGGTLTNWPATRDPQGKVMLRPIELSQSLFELADESLEDKAMQVRQAFNASHQPEMDTPWVVEVYDDHVICRHGDKLYRVPYTTKDGEITFAAQSEWAEVKPAYVEAMQAVTSALKSFFGRFMPGNHQPAAPAAPEEGVLEMEITPEKLKEMIDAAVKAAVPAPAQPPTGQPPAMPADLAQFLGMANMTEEGKKQLQSWMASQAQTVQQQAELAFKAEMVRIQRENTVGELSTRLTGGTTDAPRGLRGVTADELRTHLLKLPADEAKWFGELLERTVKDGLVEFGELGHSRKLKGLQPVPAEAHESLRAAIAAGNSPQAFFELAGLGDAADYDLSQFVTKEK